VKAAARRWLWPLFIVGSSLAFVLAFARGAAEESVMIVPLAQIATLFVLESFLPAEPQGIARRDPGLRNDLAHIFVGNSLGTVVSDTLVLAMTALLAGRLSALAGGALWPASWPFAVQAVLVIFLADGLDTLRHRWLHASHRLWPIHAIHHAGDHLNVTKSGKNHFLDPALRGLLVYVPLALLGAPPEALLAHAAAVTVLGPIAHANLDLAVPPWLDRWLMTPAVHHVHHARSPELALHNYTNLFPFWDRVFGSFRDPSGLPRPPAGLEQDPNPPGFVAQLLAPLGWR
jgi:sterol desaturase/sphingolipid hydroxylase (fatty acid hydroxylase superfamily)